MSHRCSIEHVKVVGGDLLERVECIIHEGNVRRINIKHGRHAVAEFPLTAGVVVAPLSPMLATIGALAAALTHCTLVVERVDMSTEPIAHNGRAR